MRNYLFLSLTLLLGSAACADISDYWIAVDTTAYQKDPSPSLERASYYTAYSCTMDEAESIFGQSSTSEMLGSFYSDFSSAKSGLSSSATQLTGTSYGLGQYSFISYFGNALADDDYLAFVLYENNGENAVLMLTDGVFDDGAVSFDHTTAGGWSVVSVPEPTSALLMLFGLAGLALKRRA